MRSASVSGTWFALGFAGAAATGGRRFPTKRLTGADEQ
jgi:hypothetical protein